jgi:primary-amine oxidase
MRIIIAALFFVLVAVTAAAQVYKPQHPMDALTAEEIKQVVEILTKAGKTNKDTLYPVITLLEPPKSEVLSWKSGDKPKRQAFVVLRDKTETYEATVDLDQGQVLSHAIRPGAEPMILDAEWKSANDKFMGDLRFKRAVERRGYKDLKSVYCTPVSAGYFPSEGYEKRRILKIPCFDRNGKLHPTLGRPIEGLLGVVDTERGEVIDVIDRDVVPLPPPPKGYGEDLPKPRPPMKPVEIAVLKGSNIKAKNALEIEWLDWSFHVRADRRAGIILSLARFQDGTASRLIAYQMAVSELFVPYMDPDPTWSFKTYMDAGEFGLGYLISSLQSGIDCPPDALMVDLAFHGDTGGSYKRPRALCVFERATGDPAWRHWSSGRKVVDGRPEIELVVRFIPTLGNYDYVMDFVFSPRGTIKLRAGATGFDAIKSVASADMDAPTAAADTANGNLIAPYTVAPNHDHYISYRLDLDIDGQQNSFVRDLFEPGPAAGLRKSQWTVKTQRYKTEGPIVPDHGAAGGEVWRIVNNGTRNALKQRPSYIVHTGHDATSILAEDDPPQMRAQFSAHTLWISTYKPGEYWAAGAYPNLSTKDEGLPAFVADAESIADQDLVVWYTMGFRHITRPEDFPILPTLWHEMTLRPANFFSRDPASLLNPEFATK